jgi:hypothetical protein
LADISVIALIKTEYEVLDWIHLTQVKVIMVGSCEEGNEYLGSTENIISWPAE